MDASLANRVRPSVAFTAEKAPALIWGPLREVQREKGRGVQSPVSPISFEFDTQVLKPASKLTLEFCASFDCRVLV